MTEKSKSEIGTETIISQLQDQVKKLTIGNSKKLSGKIFHYLTRNMYLKITTESNNSALLTLYLYYIDGKYIRKNKNINFKLNNNRLFVQDQDGNLLPSLIKKPISTNIVPLGNFTYLYYNLSITESGNQCTEIYFIGPNMYVERHKMFKFCRDYKLFRKNKKEKEIVPTIIVKPYQNKINILDKKLMPAKQYEDIISKKKDEIIESIEAWDDTNITNWYKEHNLIHKYNLLLSGPPGTGKTSLIYYIAGRFKRDIYVMDLSLPLMELKAESLDPEDADHAIIIIEDIDISLNLENKSDIQKQVVEDKIQWLMQVLDGTDSINNAIIVITTNKLEKIDKRLLRKSRIDKKVEIEYFDRDEMKQMCDRFNVNIEDVVSKEIVSIQPVELQSLIMEHLFKTIQQDL